MASPREKKPRTRASDIENQVSGSTHPHISIRPHDLDPSITFSTLFGVSAVIRELSELFILPRKYRRLFRTHQVPPSRGVLLLGPPGSGKTHVALALVNELRRETGQPFPLFMVPGPEFIQKYVGEGERMMRELFAQATATAPSVVLLDKLECIGGRREWHDHQYRTIVSQLLTLISGVEGGGGDVVVVATTDRPEHIDPALRRPGRLDREVWLTTPDLQARHTILMQHGGHVASGYARHTRNMSVPQIKQLCDEAKLSAIIRAYPEMGDDGWCSDGVPFREITVTDDDYREALKMLGDMRTGGREEECVEVGEDGGADQPHITHILEALDKLLQASADGVQSRDVRNNMVVRVGEARWMKGVASRLKAALSTTPYTMHYLSLHDILTPTSTPCDTWCDVLSRALSPSSTPTIVLIHQLDWLYSYLTATSTSDANRVEFFHQQLEQALARRDIITVMVMTDKGDGGDLGKLIGDVRVYDV